MSEETTPDDLTKPQRDALKRAWDILTEHFDRVLLVVDADLDSEDGPLRDYHQCFWHGGSMSAIGLSEFAKLGILATKSRENPPDDPDHDPEPEE